MKTLSCMYQASHDYIATTCLFQFHLVTRWFVWCGGLASMYLLEKLCRDRADYVSTVQC